MPHFRDEGHTWRYARKIWRKYKAILEKSTLVNCLVRSNEKKFPIKNIAVISLANRKNSIEFLPTLNEICSIFVLQWEKKSLCENVDQLQVKKMFGHFFPVSFNVLRLQQLCYNDRAIKQRATKTTEKRKKIPKNNQLTIQLAS